jgi:hypothetical protein
MVDFNEHSIGCLPFRALNYHPACGEKPSIFISNE